jgi:signal transduction histidine kinase
VAPTADEIGRLARTMNEMLDRLEAASERQRHFVADASHELQSPLTSFRAQLEVALAHPAATDWAVLAADLLADSERMERLVRDLLFLARVDSTPAPPAADPVDFDDIVLDEAARLRAGTRVRLDTSRVSAAPVRGSRDELTRLTRNLLENAARHAASTVCVGLTYSGETAQLVVEDDGPGVPPEQHERIFDRFVRIDDARSRHSGGTGLGLAIVKAIAERHGGTVAVQNGCGGARFVVRLPATWADSDHSAF